MSSVIGIDLGGTKIAASAYSAIGERLRDAAAVTGASIEIVLGQLADVVSTLREDDTTAIGIGVPGLTGLDGIVRTMPNIPGATDVPLASLLSERTGLPVFIDNDANCFTLAEALYGAGQGESVVVGVTLGTGVGGGIVIDGRVFRGSHGYAGEIGHMLLRPGEPPYDTNDRRGDVEQFLSGRAMGRRCEAAGKPEEYLEGAVCAFMRPEIFREAGWLCVSLTHLLDPSVIVFGGSAGRALKPYLVDVLAAIEQWSLPGTPPPRLAAAALPHAATLGAALLARSNA